eukprot:Clim_evm90s88 gene=Clim_evmTU90s88
MAVTKHTHVGIYRTTTADIAVDLQAETVSQEGEDVIVKWSDGHESTYHTSFIRNVVEGKEEGPKANQSKHNRILWNVERVNSVASPDVDYASLMSEDKETEIKAQVSLFKNLWTMGYAFIQSVPACPTKTEEMAARIGPIMNTLYGSFYDFVPDLEYEDTAYTNFELLAHTDTTYLHQPAGLQMFHILEAKNVVGGESTLTDGFFITNSLKQNDPELYEFMKRQTVKFHFKDHHNNMKTEYPVITEDKHGDIQHIRWNDDDRDVQDHVESKDLDSFYRAVRTWVKMCNDPSNQYTFSLQPGTALIFDNWRVMHGRKEFTGFRRMSGCYHARSDFLSKLRHYGIIA